jgi:hypothetical protein
MSRPEKGKTARQTSAVKTYLQKIVSSSAHPGVPTLPPRCLSPTWRGACAEDSVV